MQQVTAGSRFWWRALDAQTPSDPRDAVPSPSKPSRQAPVWHFPSRPRPAKGQAEKKLKLEIPQSDRRRRPRRQRARRSVAGLVLIAGGTFAISALVAAVMIGAGSFDRERLEVTVRASAQDALLALGFGLDQVSLTGQNFTSDRDVFDALNLDRARTLASFDAPAALKRIEGLPWVESAQITRVFPTALRVEIRERQPSALWQRGGKTYLIDVSGRVLGLAAEPQAWSLPRIAGEGASNEAALIIATLDRYPEIRRELAYGERKGERRWSLVLKNDTRLELAADRESEGLDQISRNSDLKRALTGPAFVVDVRTPGRLVMRPANGDAPLRFGTFKMSAAGQSQ